MRQMKLVIEVELDGVGAAIKAAREQAGITVAVAGDRAGMSGANFSRIENEDNKGVPLPTLIKVAEVVGLDLSQVLGDWVKSIPGVALNKGNKR